MKPKYSKINWTKLLTLASEQGLDQTHEQMALGMLAKKIRSSLFGNSKSEDFVESSDFESLSLALGFNPMRLREGIESLQKTIF